MTAETTPAVTVTQASREAASAYYYSAGGSPNVAHQIREGKKDDWFRVQAFARHEQTAYEAGKLEGARLMQEAADGKCEWPQEAKINNEFARGMKTACTIIQQAIRDLDRATVLRNTAGGDA